MAHISGYRYPRQDLEKWASYFGDNDVVKNNIAAFLKWMDEHEGQKTCDESCPADYCQYCPCDYPTFRFQTNNPLPYDVEEIKIPRKPMIGRPVMVTYSPNG